MKDTKPNDGFTVSQFYMLDFNLHGIMFVNQIKYDFTVRLLPITSDYFHLAQ